MKVWPVTGDIVRFPIGEIARAPSLPRVVALIVPLDSEVAEIEVGTLIVNVVSELIVVALRVAASRVAETEALPVTWRAKTGLLKVFKAVQVLVWDRDGTPKAPQSNLRVPAEAEGLKLKELGS